MGVEDTLTLRDVLPGEWTLMRRRTPHICGYGPREPEEPQYLDMEVTDEIQLYYPSADAMWWETGTLDEEDGTWIPDTSPRSNQFTHVTLTMVDLDHFAGEGDYISPSTPGCINATWELELTRR